MNVRVSIIINSHVQLEGSTLEKRQKKWKKNFEFLISTFTTSLIIVQLTIT